MFENLSRNENAGRGMTTSTGVFVFKELIPVSPDETSKIV
jgi:hypothetical protein